MSIKFHITNHAAQRYEERYGGTPQQLMEILKTIHEEKLRLNVPRYTRSLQMGRYPEQPFTWRGVRLCLTWDVLNRMYVLKTVLPLHDERKGTRDDREMGS